MSQASGFRLRAPALGLRRPGLHLRASWLRGLTALFFLGCVTGLVAWPWLSPDITWERLPDALIHLVRIFAVGAALGRGEAYPRWLGDLDRKSVV